jgi:hypothetical protein
MKNSLYKHEREAAHEIAVNNTAINHPGIHEKPIKLFVFASVKLLA